MSKDRPRPGKEDISALRRWFSKEADRPFQGYDDLSKDPGRQRAASRAQWRKMLSYFMGKGMSRDEAFKKMNEINKS